MPPKKTMMPPVPQVRTHHTVPLTGHDKAAVALAFAQASSRRVGGGSHLYSANASIACFYVLVWHTGPGRPRVTGWCGCGNL